jgi:hypothetical protein
MKWFLVRYIYQIVGGSDSYHAQFDEQLRLMLASGANDALKKAEDLAGSFQPPFKNCKGEEVTWKFISVADLHEIPTPGDGAEVTSILHEPSDVSVFLDGIQQRKAFLQQHIKCENEFIETL